MDPAIEQRIEMFLKQPAFAVAGASTNRDKYGNKVVRAFQRNNRVVFPINPAAETVENLKCYPDVASIPDQDVGLSLVTPPKITLSVVREALALGVRFFWMQPGAENPEAIAQAKSEGATVIHGGSCVLVALGYTE